MALEVIGTPVASGIYDPSTGFMVAGGIIIIGSIAYGIWQLIHH